MVFGLKETDGRRLTEAAQSARQAEEKGENKATTATPPAASAFIGTGAGAEDPGTRGVTQPAGLATDNA
jgi:hypothetical protein